MSASLRDPVETCQRHPVTDFRFTTGMGDNKTFGQRIRELRDDLGLSQSELARLVGLGVATISGLELGTQRSTAKIDLLAGALKTSPEYLRTGKYGKSAPPIPDTALTSREARLIERFRALSEDGRARAEGFVAALPDKRRTTGRGQSDRPVAERKRRSF